MDSLKTGNDGQRLRELWEKKDFSGWYEFGKSNVAGFEDNMPDYMKALVPKLIDGQSRSRAVYRPDGLHDADLEKYLTTPTPDHVVFCTKSKNLDISFQISQVLRIVGIIERDAGLSARISAQLDTAESHYTDGYQYDEDAEEWVSVRDEVTGIVKTFLQDEGRSQLITPVIRDYAMYLVRYKNKRRSP